jgi:hypothetical protein
MEKNSSDLSMLLKTDIKNNEKPNEEFKTFSQQTSRLSECGSESFETVDHETVENEADNTKTALNGNDFLEKQEIGAVNWNVYAVYFKAAGGLIVPIVILFLFLASYGLNIAADYWLSLW